MKLDHNFSGGAATREIVKGPEVCGSGASPTADQSVSSDKSSLKDSRYRR